MPTITMPACMRSLLDDTHCTLSMLSHMQACLQSDLGTCLDADLSSWQEQLQSIFVFAYVWSIGGRVSPAQRQAFDGGTRRAFAGLAAELPAEGLLFDYDVKLVEGAVAFVPWAADVAPPGLPLCDMIVPAAQSTCLQRLSQVSISLKPCLHLSLSCN